MALGNIQQRNQPPLFTRRQQDILPVHQGDAVKRNGAQIQARLGRDQPGILHTQAKIRQHVAYAMQCSQFIHQGNSRPAQRPAYLPWLLATEMPGE